MPSPSRHGLLALLLVAAACGGTTLPGNGSGGDAGQHPPATDSGSPRPGIDGGTCNLVQIESPVLTVTDALTGKPICDATLVAGQTTVSLFPDGSAPACTYTVNGSSGSTFSISITAPGYGVATVNGLMVRYCGCEGACEAPQQVSASLSPGVSPPSDGGLPVRDASFTPCPPSAPTQGGACSVAGLYCEYGSDPNPYCNGLWECMGSTWQNRSTSGICPAPGTTCPAYGTIDSNQKCTVASQNCDYTEGTCVCTSDPGGPPIGNGPVWSCTPITPGCPAPRPVLGTGCSVDPSLTCDYGACSGGVAESCVNGTWAIATNIACAL